MLDVPEIKPNDTRVKEIVDNIVIDEQENRKEAHHVSDEVGSSSSESLKLTNALLISPLRICSTPALLLFSASRLSRSVGGFNPEASISVASPV